MKNWNVRKRVVAREDMPEEHRLHQSLSWPHLIALGVGAIVGTGILTLTGVGAAKAGPAVILSFAIAGVICAFAALAYAEMATMYPASGSAYTYSYIVFGELIAWIVGWSLILEYSLVVSAVAVGWSGYAAGFLASIDAALPGALIQGPELGGVINLPAIFIIAVVAGLLIYGTRESANLNALLVVVKLLALALFIIVALPAFNADNFQPFMPYGFPRSGPSGFGSWRHGGGGHHLLRLLRLRRDRDGSRGSRRTRTAISPSASSARWSFASSSTWRLRRSRSVRLAYTRFADSPEPLALILREIGQGWAARILGVSAVIALPTVILAFFFGQSRIFFVMARDGLLPTNLARVSSRGTPVRITLFTAVVVAAIAGFFPLAEIAALANAGTLTAFIAVSAAMIAMRQREPNAPRRFTTPLPWVVGIGAILGCAYLFWSLPVKTQTYFLIWNAGGLILYWLYGHGRAEKARASAGA